MLTTIRKVYFWLGISKNIDEDYFWPSMRKKYPFHFYKVSYILKILGKKRKEKVNNIVYNGK